MSKILASTCLLERVAKVSNRANTMGLTNWKNYCREAQPAPESLGNGEQTTSKRQADQPSENTTVKIAQKTAMEYSENGDHVNLKGAPPEPPTTCCMSGCPNCVWIDYAEELVKYYKDGTAKQKVLEEIEKIEDPSLKAFLKIELS